MPVAAAEQAAFRHLSVGTLATNLLIAAVGFAGTAVIGRAFGPSGRGDIAAFQIIPSIAALVFALGLPQAATYFAATRQADAPAVIWRCIRLAFGAGTIGAAVAAVLSWFYLGGHAAAGLRTAGLISSLSVLLIPLIGVTLHPLRSINRTGAWNVLRIFFECSMVGVAVLVLAGERSYTTLALAKVAWLALLLAAVWPLWQRRLAARAAPVADRDLVSYGIPTMLAATPYFLNFRLDQLVLLAFSGSAELGLYATAVTWSAASLPVMKTVAHLVVARLAAMTSGRDAAAARYVRASIALATATAILLSVASPLAILLLFGPAFGASVGLAVGLSLATAVLGVTMTAEEVLRAYADVRYPARAELIGLALNTVLLLALVPRFGAWGAVAASGVTYVAVCRAVLGRVRRVASLQLTDLIPGRRDLELLAALCPGPWRR